MATHYIRKTYGKWSSNTQVELIEEVGGIAEVVHESSREKFKIPAELLVAKRDRRK